MFQWMIRSYANAEGANVADLSLQAFNEDDIITSKDYCAVGGYSKVLRAIF
jgi:hypothetical protein